MLPKLEPNAFDIIFADPPYKTPFGKLVVEKVDQLDLLKLDGVMVLEHLKDAVLPESLVSLTKYDARHYGQTTLSFFRRIT